MAVDKLLIETRQEVDINFLKSISECVEVIKWKRFFKEGRKFTLLTGQDVYLYWNRSYSQISLIPSKFSGYKFIAWLLENCLCEGNLEEPKIKELHLKVDLEGYHPEEIIRIISPARFRKMYRYSQYDEHRDGKLESWCLNIKNCSYYYGSKGQKRIVVYDAQKKHKLLVPTTRVEARIEKPAMLKNLDFVYLPVYLRASNPFESVKFLEKFETVFAKPSLKAKADHFSMLVAVLGFHGARKKVSRMIPKYRRVSSYGKILKGYCERNIPVSKLYKESINHFLTKTPSVNELRVMTSVTPTATSKFGAVSV